jgi:PKD domain
MVRPNRLLRVLLAAIAVSLLTAPARADVINFPLPCMPCEGMAVGAGGEMYVTDEFAGRVYKVSPSGLVVATFGSGGGYSFGLPRGVATTSDGNLAVADMGTSKVITPSGALVRVVGVDASDVASDRGGNLYFASGSSVVRVAPDGSMTSWDTGAFVGGIAYSDANGHVYALSPSAVLEYTASGEIVRSIGGHLIMPQDVVADDQGRVYVSQLHSPPSIVRYAEDGTFEAEFATVGLGGSFPAFQPRQLAFANAGLYASHSFGVARIDARDPAARIQASTGVTSTSRLVTFDASGSFMPFGTVDRYEWDLDGDGGYETDGGAAPTVGHRFVAAGDAAVGVRVTGSTGRQTTATTTVRIERSSARISVFPLVALTGERVTLDAGGSSLADSHITNVRWDLDGDGSFELDTGQSLAATHVYSTPGSYNAQVQVSRSGGVVDRATAPVDIRAAPPPGHAGVSINGGARFTNTPEVEISLVWPLFAQNVVLSNDGGFRQVASVPVTPTLSWRLASSGPERLPKTVYARFDDIGQSTYQDDIILDETAPRVTAASLTAAKGLRQGSVLRVRARDNASRVRFIQVRINRQRRARTFAFVSRLRLKGLPQRARVRVRDGAGNTSRWRTVKSRYLQARHRRGDRPEVGARKGASSSRADSLRLRRDASGVDVADRATSSRDVTGDRCRTTPRVSVEAC